MIDQTFIMANYQSCVCVYVHAFSEPGGAGGGSSSSGGGSGGGFGGSSGPMPMGGLFSKGVPKLRPVGGNIIQHR